MAKKEPADNDFSEENIIKIWEKAVDTQMHFNEMSAKSRQLGLTFVAAALGVSVLLMSDSKDYHYTINLFCLNLKIYISSIVIIGAAVGVFAVKMLDVNVYHKMLRGAVSFGEDFESKYIAPKLKLSKGMTQAVSHFSRYEDAQVDKSSSPYNYTGQKMKTAGDKVNRFYNLTIASLIFIFITMFIIQNISGNI